jgi:hypothetical protein
MLAKEAIEICDNVLMSIVDDGFIYTTQRMYQYTKNFEDSMYGGENITIHIRKHRGRFDEMTIVEGQLHRTFVVPIHEKDLLGRFDSNSITPILRELEAQIPEYKMKLEWLPDSRFKYKKGNWFNRLFRKNFLKNPVRVDGVRVVLYRKTPDYVNRFFKDFLSKK